MKIKSGDMVIVIAGKDKDKTGKVLKTLPKENKVIVEGINIQYKHKKPSSPQQAGSIDKNEGPISVSNVMFYDEKTKTRTRVGYKIENGKKIRISKKSGEILDK